jgi:hypothetical protein
MASDARKSLNRLSALFIRPSKPASGKSTPVDTPATPDLGPSPFPPHAGDMTAVPYAPPAWQLQQEQQHAARSPATPPMGPTELPDSANVSPRSNARLSAQPHPLQAARQRSASSSFLPTVKNRLRAGSRSPNASGQQSRSSVDRGLPPGQLHSRQSFDGLRQASLAVQGHHGARAVSTTALVGPPPVIPNQVVDPSYNYIQPEQAAHGALKKKRWGGKADSKLLNRAVQPAAWIAGTTARPPYDVSLLASGAKVPELWLENGNALIYLFPKGTGIGPSFRLSSELFASSKGLASFAHGGIYSTDQAGMGAEQFPPGTTSIGASPNHSQTDGSDSSREARGLVDVDNQMLHLYLPIDLSNPTARPLSRDDVQRLVRVRNLFAFLIGQSLVATPMAPTVYDVFFQISKLLMEFGFSNMDDSSFGEIASASFSSYAEELGLMDMRGDCAKTVEGLCLGEKMRSSLLWNEAFTHGTGMYDNLERASPEKFKALSPVAVQRLERAHMDLEKRKMRINDRLTDFDFPNVFSGIMNSKQAPESEFAGFDQWKSAFNSTRRWMLTHLKSKHGAWPPKSKGKKGGLNIPALNRRVLQGLGSDLALLYDLMVDRRHPSSRLVIYGKNFPPHPDRRIEALRKVLNESDTSSTPVCPVMPFDAPLLPRIDPEADPDKKVGKNQLPFVLNASYNQDVLAAKLPFAHQWQAFEHRSTSGMTVDRIANFRLGAWLFFYVVLQTLPRVTVDAPGIRFYEGCEYFLCQPARGRLHWSREAPQKEWFRDPVTGALTQMQRDAIELSDDAIYRLSHCWRRGEVWEQDLTVLPGTNPPPLPLVTETHPDVHHQPAVPPVRQSVPQFPPQPGPYGPQGYAPAPAVYDHAQPPADLAAQPPAPFALPQQPLMQSPPQLQQAFAPQQQLPFHPAPHHAATLPPPQQHQQQQQQQLDPRAHAPHHQSSYPPLPAAHARASSSAPDSPNPSALLDLPPGALGAGLLTADPGAAAAAPGQGTRSRGTSPYGMGRRGNRESVLMMGLERLPVPAMAVSAGGSGGAGGRVASMTFEDILPPRDGLAAPRARGRAGSRGQK